jgi:quinol monooxygenase YgiN
MYIRTVALTIKPGSMDEAIKIFQDSVIPAAKQQKGFTSVNLGTDRSANKAVIIGFWETEADMLASESNGFFQEQMTKLGVTFAAPPVRTVYELNAQSW